MAGGSPTFDLKGVPYDAGVRLIDINGDSRADWVYIQPDGNTKIFINAPGTKEGSRGLKPTWFEAKQSYVGFPKENPDFLKFGRFYGTAKEDLIQVVEKKENNDFQYELLAFKNTGKGGTRHKGDGVRFCGE